MEGSIQQNLGRGWARGRWDSSGPEQQGLSHLSGPLPRGLVPAQWSHCPLTVGPSLPLLLCDACLPFLGSSLLCSALPPPLHRHVPLNSICDTRAAQDSNLIATHLENNFIDRRRIPPTAFSCIRAYHSVVLQPQQGEGESS